MVCVELSGEVDHETPFRHHKKTEVVECCQDKKNGFRKLFPLPDSHICFLNYKQQVGW